MCNNRRIQNNNFSFSLTSHSLKLYFNIDMFNSKINVISNKRKKDSQEKDTLKIHKRCVINYCFFTVEGNKINQRETIQNEYDLQIDRSVSMFNA